MRKRAEGGELQPRLGCSYKFVYVVVDNLGSHKVADVSILLKADFGISVLFQS